VRVFELRITSRPKREMGGRRKLHNEELQNLYFSSDVIIVVKSRRIK
jgi:hypothetical protein